MAITLYFAPMSSASPVVWALAELGIPYEGVRIDLKGTAHKQPEFLALNPMGQVPTLVDDGQAMFESSAIIVYLGEKYGEARGLWPRVGSPEHMMALTWTSWHAVTLGTTLRQIFVSSPKLQAPPEMHNAAICDRATARFGELMDILNGHLATREYLTGAQFALVDCYAAASLWWATHVIGFDLQRVPHVAAYVQRCMARPASATMRS